MAWTYDPRGRVTGKSQTVGGYTKTVGYGYTNGNLVSLVTPSNQTVVYGYTNHRITSITLNGATILSNVIYDPFGPAKSWSWGNTTTVARVFDQDGNPNQFTAAGVTNGYTVDNAFRITAISDSGLSSNSWVFDNYDALDRIKTAHSSAKSRGYTYDANGNRLTTAGTSPSVETPDPASNKLNSTTGTYLRTYSYDTAGNTTSYASNVYTFNNSGRMATAMVSGSSTSYVYNALGELIEKSGNGGTTFLVYDERGHVLGEYSSTGGVSSLIQETIWMDDIPIMTIYPSGSFVVAYYIQTDHSNNPRKIVRPSDNALMWRWDPDTFGGAPPSGVITYNLRFPGQYALNESGIYYNYFRDYDPQMGRYVESDPVGLQGGINTYAYVADRPTMATDPRGLFLCDDWKWMAVDWALGLGDRNRTYGAESDQIQQLKNLPRVNWARQRYQQKNASNKGACCDASKLHPVTDVGSKFGIVQFLQATMQGNCAWHFIGSFSLDVTPISCTQARFTITNDSSFNSFSYGLGPSWNGGPMGNFYQNYTWDENL